MSMSALVAILVEECVRVYDAHRFIVDKTCGRHHPSIIIWFKSAKSSAAAIPREEASRVMIVVVA